MIQTVHAAAAEFAAQAVASAQGPAGLALPFAHAGDWVGGLFFFVPILVLVPVFRVLSRLSNDEDDASIEAVNDERPAGTGADPASISAP